MAEKLVATVLGISDLGEESLAEGGPEERIDLEVQVQKGEVYPGQRVRLAGPGYEGEAAIRGVIMFKNLHDPSWTRITCSKPKSHTTPAGDLTGWTITEL